MAEMESALKVGIVGAGAIGCYLGSRLAAAGAEVAFFGRPRFAAEAARYGLCAVDMDGHRSVIEKDSVVFGTEPSVLADCVVLLSCVKSAQTAEAARQIAPVIRADACIVSFQNGLGNADVLSENLGGRAALGGIVGFNVRPLGRGVFQQATSGELVVEDDGIARAPIATLTQLLTKAGLKVQLAKDIKALQWAKLMMNLNNAVCALSGVPLREMLASSGYRRILADLIAEALGVLRAAGIRPGRLGAVPAKWFPSVLRLPDVLFRLLARAQLKIDAQARSSMWEDLSGGRPTEVDYLNGEIVRLAEKHGVEAPMNRRITALVHDAETKKLSSSGMSAELMRRALS